MRHLVGIGLLLLLLVLPCVPFRAAEAGDAADVRGLFANLHATDAAARSEARDALVFRLVADLPREASLAPESRPSIDHVRQALRNDDPTVRIVAAAAAARLDVEARALYPELVAALREPSDPLRYWLYEALRRLGPGAAPAAPRLAELLHEHAEWGLPFDGDWAPDAVGGSAADVLLVVLFALGCDGLAAVEASLQGRTYVRPALQAVLQALRRHVHGPAPASGEEPARPEVAVPSPEEWLVRLESPGEDGAIEAFPTDGRRSAFEALHAFGTVGIPALLHAVDDGSPFVRQRCLEILAALGPKAEAAAPRLAELLEAEDQDLRRGALVALAATNAADVHWLPQLLPLLEQDDETTRRAAVQVLGAIGSEARMARARLGALLAQVRRATSPSDGAVRLEAALVEALGRIGGPAEHLVPAFLHAAVANRTAHPRGVWHMRRAPRWQREGPPAVSVREVAMAAIGRLGLAALPALGAWLDDEDPRQRAEAVRALSRLPLDPVLTLALESALDPSPAVREAAVATLAREPRTPCLRALMALVADSEGRVRLAAIAALARLGPAAEAAAVALLAPLRGGTPEEVRACLDALRAIRPDAETLHAPALVEALQREGAPVDTVLWHLRELGPGAQGVLSRVVGAVPALEADEGLNALRLVVGLDPTHPALAGGIRALLVRAAPGVRRQAIGYARHLALDDPETVAILAAQLAHEVADVAAAAAGALATLAARSTLAADALARYRDDPRERVRVAALRGLAAAGRGAEVSDAAIALLGSPDADVRAVAVETLTAIGGVESAFKPLRERLATDDAHQVRFRLWPAIASTGEQGVRFLLHELPQVEEHLRFQARSALVHGGRHVVPELRRWLSSGDMTTWYAAASLLGRIGEPARVAIPDLIRLAETGHPQALHAATEALHGIGVADEVLLPYVARCLAADDVTRTMGCRIVGDLGARAAPIRADVERVLHLEKFLGLEGAVECLAALGAEGLGAVPALVAALPGARPADRTLILAGLGRLAEHGTAPRAALLRALRDPHADARITAASALAGHYAADPGVVARVGERLADADVRVARHAAARLGSLGEAALPARSALVVTTGREDRELVRLAFRAIAQVRGSAHEVLPFLLRQAQGTDAWRARGALAALGRLAPDHPEVERVIQRAEDHWDWRVRLGAQEARAAGDG